MLGRDLNSDEIYAVGNGGNAAWGYGRGSLKAYTEELSVKRKLLKVRGAMLANKYFPRAWDFVIPRARLKTVLKILESGGEELG